MFWFWGFFVGFFVCLVGIFLLFFFFCLFWLLLYFVLFSSLILALQEVWKSKTPARFDDIFWIYPQCFSKLLLWAAEAGGCRGEPHPRCVLSTCSLGDEQLLDKSWLDLAAGLAEQHPTADLDLWGASLHTAPEGGELTYPPGMLLLPPSPNGWPRVWGNKWLFYIP